ncbi:ribonuclease D [Hymenobacter cellulosilyticus]|uniref:HRDC domain-containing protein n=1 Tax=Hymenobacter cellulosilyticus TaxID=2932248 RepID=A0A8T9Q961_9BACT|nr:HRDC domain-containing protein [Hymenobacter cellulosilyticus]UOQ72059.1 HRDC domain-containing protein [Hymenobacter cellulosilyticus]
MSTPTIQYLTTAAEMEQAGTALQTAKRLAVDLEFDDMRHRYGRNLALIQIYDGQVVYLLDPIPLTNPAQELEPIWALLRDPAVEKVFHSCKSDILLLDELYGVHVRNILDTSVQYTLLGESDNNISLGRLIQAELGLEVDKGEQKSNWLKRPLTEAQKVYAANDVLYLFELADRLKAKLDELGRTEWAEQENAALEEVRYTRDDRPYLRIAGKYRILPGELPLFRDLYMLRDQVARQLDKPPYMVFANDRLSELVRDTPRDANDWKNTRGLHPELKRTPYLEQLAALSPDKFVAVPEPAQTGEQRRFPFRRRLTGDKAAKADAREQLLTQLKGLITADINVYVANLVLSNRLVADIVELGADQVLRPWQKTILQEACQRHGLDYGQIAEPF